MAFNSQSTVAAIPTSITQAIDFLTRPLILIHAPTKIVTLQLILQSTLTAVYIPSRSMKHPRMTLSLSHACLPPRPIYAACIGSGVQWSDWISVLGGASFDLHIDPTCVSVKVGEKTATVWRAPEAPAMGCLPRSNSTFASRAGSSIQASLRATVNSAVARAKSRTLAQQLLESDHEDEEAEEIFTMISNTTMISPTPTRGQFHITLPVSPPSPVSSPASSRPSSRSSIHSGYSFSSSEESVTTVSSIGSTQAAFLFDKKDLKTETRPRREPTESARVYVDSSKKEVTRYSYEGGVSTVLTGGVMLGGQVPQTKTFKPAMNRPAWTKKASTFTSGNTNADNNNNWRRAARV